MACREANIFKGFCFTVVTALMCGCVSSTRLALFDEIVIPILEEDRIQGAVIVVGEGDRIIYRAEYGTARLDTLFDLASLTKVVATTTAAMLLVEEGRLSLDDDPGR